MTHAPGPARRGRHLLAALLLPLLAALPAPAHGEVAEDAWQDARRDAARLMKVPGELRDKEKALATLGRDDSERAAELLVKWATTSLAMRKKDLQPAFEKALDRLERLEAQLKKAYVEPYTDENDNGRHDEDEPYKDKNRNGKRDGWPPRNMNTDHRHSWNTLKKAHADALNEVQVEDMVQEQIAGALASITDTAAARWLATDGIKALDRAKEPGPVRLGIVACLLHQKDDWRVPHLLRLGGRGEDPKARVHVVNWAGREKMAVAFAFVVEALGDAHMAVRRAAVLALQNYDDVKAVKHLIDALAKTEGLMAQEIEEVLHWYTGQSFNASARIWKKWFQSEGQDWLAKGETARHKPQAKGHAGTGTSFYDIPTESKRIVFVLDRSGSMKEPAGDKSQKEKTRPRGPITGGGDKDKGPLDDDGPIAGETKLEVAKNKLQKTVENLARDVEFGLVFYSTDIEVWKAPPELLPASQPNKDDAVRWFKALEPKGSTSLFPSLMRALEYADAFGAAGDKRRKKGSSGANTIYLLSDGAPTNPEDGKALPNDVVEQQLSEFLAANETYHCVVHTIGIGPTHKRQLMQRLAAATGGQYVAVGAD